MQSPLLESRRAGGRPPVFARCAARRVAVILAVAVLCAFRGAAAEAGCIQEDGVVQPGEVCDDGFETATCDADCTLPSCGDAVVNHAAGEVCDDGNAEPADGCESDCTTGSEPAAAALAKLNADSSDPVEVHIDGAAPVFVTLRIAVPAGLESPLDRALWFLETYREFYRLEDPVLELFPTRLLKGNTGETVFFGQRIGNVVVEGAHLSVHFDGEEVVATSGRYLANRSELAKPVEPALDAEDAEGLVLAALPLTKPTVVPESALVLFDSTPQNSPLPPQWRLAWRVQVRGFGEDGTGSTWRAFVDAASGEVLASHDTTPEADFDLSTANNSTTDHCWSDPFNDPSTQWFTEDGATSDYPGGDIDGDRMDAFTRATYNFYRTRFGRDSFDDDNGQIEVFVHVGTNWANANGTTRCIEFGDGMIAYDTFVHEFTHAVTQTTANFVFLWESGALHESYSDILGAIADGDWTQGEDVRVPSTRCIGGPGNATRNLEDPTLCGQPDHFDNFYETNADDDFGGVHSNSGIFNKTAALLALGGTFRNVDVQPLGASLVGHLYFTTLTQHLGPHSGFLDARNATVRVARHWARLGYRGFTSRMACDVVNAFGSVGLLDEEIDSDCDGTPDAAIYDADADGVPDFRDNCPRVRVMDQTDHDGDGAGDVCDHDDDNDRVCDDGGPYSPGPGLPLRCERAPSGSDNCRFVGNPNQRDSDADGLGDVCEDGDRDGIADGADTCPGDPTPYQNDSDDDGVGNACDADADNDGLCSSGGPLAPPVPGVPPSGCTAAANGRDNCPNLFNPAQADGDGDAAACADLANVARDEYGCGDGCDNCPGTANPDQRDTDRDGSGNACDADMDGDGIVNTADNCPETRNADQLDSDGNGFGLVCDAEEFGTISSTRGAILDSSVVWNALYGGIRFPLFPCHPDECPRLVEPDFRQRFEMRFDRPMQGVVVDGLGQVVARAESGKVLSFVFRPGPAAWYQPAEPAIAPASKGAGMASGVSGGDPSETGAARSAAAEPFSARRYFVEVTPLEPTPDGTKLALSLRSDGVTACDHAPRTDCKKAVLPAASSLQVRRGARGGSMLWTVGALAATSADDIGDPGVNDELSFCLYDESGESSGLLLQHNAAAGSACAGGKACWKSSSNKGGEVGYRYADGSGRPSGLRALQIRGGKAGEGSLMVKASGPLFAVPELPLETPLRAQLQSTTGACWESLYLPSSVVRNDGKVFEAKSD